MFSRQEIIYVRIIITWNCWCTIHAVFVNVCVFWRISPNAEHLLWYFWWFFRLWNSIQSRFHNFHSNSVKNHRKNRQFAMFTMELTQFITRIAVKSQVDRLCLPKKITDNKKIRQSPPKHLIWCSEGSTDSNFQRNSINNFTSTVPLFEHFFVNHFTFTD